MQQIKITPSKIMVEDGKGCYRDGSLVCMTVNGE